MDFKNVKIGVFDSGIGGLSVAKYFSDNISCSEVIFVNDHENVPYGNKSNDEMLKLAMVKIRQLQVESVDAIVIACNTLTTNCIAQIRQKITIPIIGTEPMIKTASGLTKSKIVTVCATPRTLTSKRYQELKKTYASEIQVIEPDCSEWASLIEDNAINRELVLRTIKPSLDMGSDVVVLGCTHYHWIEKLVNNCTDNLEIVLQPEEALTRRLIEVLQLPD